MVATIVRAVIDALNRRKSRILDFAAIGLTPDQFQAFRRQTLEELGRDGFEKDLTEILRQLDRKG